jgi:hypothetical protein
MTVLVYNCRRTTCSSHAGLRHIDCRSAPKRRHIWRISSQLILKCISAMWGKWAANRGNHWQLKINRRLGSRVCGSGLKSLGV